MQSVRIGRGYIKASLGWLHERKEERVGKRIRKF